MIAYLKKVSANNDKIVYLYSYDIPSYDGKLDINLISGKTEVILSKGDENYHYAKLSLGKILDWNRTNTLPDEYTICTG